MARRKPLLGLEVAVRTEVPKMLKRMAETVEERLRGNAAIEDGHTLKVLASLGYPYSKANTHIVDSPPYLIHVQNSPSTGHKTGKNLSEAIVVNVINQYRIQLGVDETIAPHVADVFWGTPTMVGRDFITPSLNESIEELQTIGEEMFKGIVRHALDNATSAPEF